MAEISAIYTTYPNQEVAEKISKKLVEENKVACANIFPEHRSLYMWNDKLEDQLETAVLYKVATAQVRALIKEIHELHPYDTPAIVSLPVEESDEKYQSWVLENSKSPST